VHSGLLTGILLCETESTAVQSICTDERNYPYQLKCRS